jgi:AcrR family transcriptional regulator
MARPRSDAARQAALDATVEVLLDAGVDGVTLEEVASRSGVARSTLYRHFGSKEELVALAARRCVIEYPTPDTGSLEGDLRCIFRRLAEDEEAQRIPDLLPMLLDAANRDPEMEALLRAHLAERRRPLRTVLELAQHRGEISPALDLDDAVSIIVGPFTHRRMFDRRAITPEFVETVLAVSVAALRATVPLGAR